MSFLLGDDYGSSSSSSSGEESEHEFELDVALPRSESKQSDGGAALVLPSADSVLAGVSASSASFLAPQTAQSTATAIVEIDVFKENERAKALQAAEKAAEQQSRRDKFVSPTDELAKKRPRTTIEADEKAPAKKEKKDAKERVKAQRTKGQAGIGSDFRSWKSETEMSMRQQFD